jgi:hypothetical protein
VERRPFHPFQVEHIAPAAVKVQKSRPLTRQLLRVKDKELELLKTDSDGLRPALLGRQGLPREDWAT